MSSDGTNFGSNHLLPSLRRLEDKQYSARSFNQFGSAAQSSRNYQSPPGSLRLDNPRQRGSLEPHYNIRHFLSRRQEQRIRHYEFLPERQIESQLQVPEDTFDTLPVGAVDGRTVNNETPNNRQIGLRRPLVTIQHDSVDNRTPNRTTNKNNNLLFNENVRMPSEIQASSVKQPILDSYAPPDISFNRGQQSTDEPGQPPRKIDIVVLTGSISQMQRWYGTIPTGSFFELNGYLISIVMANPQNRMGPGNECNYILRERRDSGQIVHIIQPYPTNFQIQRPLELGLRIRCIGRILSKKKLLAFKMSLFDEQESEFNRVEHVCRTSY